MAGHRLSSGIALFAICATFFVAPASLASVDTYQVEIRPDLGQLEITACLHTAGLEMRAGHSRAAEFLISAVAADSDHKLSLIGNTLKPRLTDRCLRYRVDLQRAARSNPRYARVGTQAVAVETAKWLWLPRNQGATTKQISFKLTPGMRVSVPWQPVSASSRERIYTIPNSPASDDSVSVFGNFPQCTIEVAQARLRTALVPGRFRGDVESLTTWLATAAHNVGLSYGRFPNPNPQIVVIPGAKHLRDSGEPVPFGHVIRNGGEAVQFFVNQMRPAEDFVADWTATHEFAHLMIPYVSATEKWISEGLASYYQNVLMARGGHYRADKAWRKIIEGFRRGENSVPHLSLENAMPLGGWDGIMKTYWGGAAIFLMADVELRRVSDGKQSLDTILDALQKCCLPSSRTWHGKRLFEKLDALAGRPVFVPLYQRYRRDKQFPGYDELLESLGLALGSNGIRMDDAAPLAAIRDRIMLPPVNNPLAYNVDCGDTVD